MMKMKVLAGIVLMVSVVLGGFSFSPAYAAEQATPELIAKGKVLFNDKAGLGVKFTCVMCHKNDKAVKLSKIKAAGDKLPEIVNNYIVKKSKGKAIAADSEQMKALIAYMMNEHAK